MTLVSNAMRHRANVPADEWSGSRIVGVAIYRAVMHHDCAEHAWVSYTGRRDADRPPGLSLGWRQREGRGGSWVVSAEPAREPIWSGRYRWQGRVSGPRSSALTNVVRTPCGPIPEFPAKPNRAVLGCTGKRPDT